MHISNTMTPVRKDRPLSQAFILFNNSLPITITFYRAMRLTAKPPPGASVSFSTSPFFTVRFVMT